jgi:histidine racemase
METVMDATYLVTAAGGNGTAVRVIDSPLTRDQYAQEGKKLGKDMEPFGAEQAGFLIPSQHHFEMSGGEFCGNASRSVAVLLANMLGTREVAFTVSGYNGNVKGVVDKQDDHHYVASCSFPGMPVDERTVRLIDGRAATVVDLGGIVHVILEEKFPAEPEAYQAQHRAITKELGFEKRGAVGVVWIEKTADTVKMYPVVWVKDVDTFFYEQSCGSGTIAVAKVTGLTSIVQPTGQTIEAKISPSAVTLTSNMEITREEH